MEVSAHCHPVRHSTLEHCPLLPVVPSGGVVGTSLSVLVACTSILALLVAIARAKGAVMATVALSEKAAGFKGAAKLCSEPISACYSWAHRLV